jgi:MFS family permease
LSFGHGTMFGLQSAYFPELFGTRVRYSGASFGFQTAAALGGGFSPIIATALAGTMGGTTGVSMMLILLALITFVAALCARETKSESLLGWRERGTSCKARLNRRAFSLRRPHPSMRSHLGRETRYCEPGNRKS